MPPPEPEPEPRSDALPTGWPTHEATRQEPRWVESEAPAEPLVPPSRPPVSAPPMTAEPAITSQTTVPEFMRRAESTARWNRPAVRIALALVSVLLAALLTLQVTLHFRDALAALHPPLRAGLQGLCGAFGCEVQPWRRIEALSIESTSLNPVGSGGYKLNLSLRNKTGVDVAAPWVELSLSDASGAPFARRVVAPDALMPQLKQVGAESEQGLSFSFSTGAQRVSGYSVNIFYP
jgi:hypothetical protein